MLVLVALCNTFCFALDPDYRVHCRVRPSVGSDKAITRSFDLASTLDGCHSVAL